MKKSIIILFALFPLVIGCTTTGEMLERMGQPSARKAGKMVKEYCEEVRAPGETRKVDEWMFTAQEYARPHKADITCHPQ